MPRRVWLLAVFLLPVAGLAAHHWNWGAPSVFGDHAQYLAHARALVEGKSYTDIGYIYHPRAAMVGPRAYPPGLPLTLAPIVAFAGTESPLIRVLMLVTLLAFAYLAYRRLAMDIAPWQAALAVGFAAFALEARYATLIPLSDAGLCVLLWATILAVDSAAKWTWPRIALVTALGFAAIAYRIAGAALVPALALYAALTWQRHRGRALIPVAVWTVAGVSLLATDAISLPFSANLLPRLSGVVGRLENMVEVYRLAVFDAELYPFGSDALNDAYHVFASIAVVAGVAALLWRLRHSMLTATVIMYVALLLASPVINARYLWPLYPVIAAGLVLGVSAACGVVARRVSWFPRRPLATAALLTIVLLGAYWRESRVPAPPSIEKRPATLALVEWLRTTHQRTPMRVLAPNPRRLTLATRIPAMSALIVPPSTHLQAMLDERLTHLIWHPGAAEECRARLANELPTIFPDRFVLEYSNPEYRVYRLLYLSEPLPAAPAEEKMPRASLCVSRGQPAHEETPR